MDDSAIDKANQMGKDLSRYDWFVAIGTTNHNEIILYVNNEVKAREITIPIYGEITIRKVGQPKIWLNKRESCGHWKKLEELKSKDHF